MKRWIERVSYPNEKKLYDALTEIKVYCKCGHSIYIPTYVEKVCCQWCGKYVYNKNEIGKKAKFRDTLKNKIKELEKKDKEKIHGRDKNTI